MHKYFIIKTTPESNDLLLSSVEVKNKSTVKDLISVVLNNDPYREEFSSKGFNYGLELVHKQNKNVKYLVMDEENLFKYIHDTL